MTKEEIKEKLTKAREFGAILLDCVADITYRPHITVLWTLICVLFLIISLGMLIF